MRTCAVVSVVLFAGLIAHPVHAQENKAPDGVQNDHPFEFSAGNGMSLGYSSVLPGGWTMGNRIGTRFGAFHPYIALEHLRVKGSADGEDATGSITSFGLGSRILLSDAGRNETTAYIPVQLILIIPSVSSEEDDVDSVVEDVQSWGLQAGFGAEHFFTNSFSISAELGIRYYTARYEEDDYELAGNLFMSYTAAMLNFYL